MFRHFQRDENDGRDNLVQDMADEAVRTVLRQLCADAVRMSAAELRGYIRARALQSVRRRAADLIENRHTTAADVDGFVAAAVERALRQVNRDRIAPPVASIPAPHVQRRAAA